MLSETRNFFAVALIIHGILFLFDKLAKNLYTTSYLLFQKRTGLRFQPFTIVWFSTTFNRCIRKWSGWHPVLLNFWFSIGVWVSLFALPIAVYFVIQSMCASFLAIISSRKDTSSNISPFLEPALPGVNIPVSDLGYYVAALLICSVFHEFGHAVAAAGEGVPINGVGIFLFLIVPVAYVRMECLDNLSSHKRLQIFCGGVWHNIVLVIGAAVVILALPVLCYPFYDYGSGIQVLSVTKNSPLREGNGIQVDDVIQSVNDCPVYDRNTWSRCLQNIAKNSTVGYCVSDKFIRDHAESFQIDKYKDVTECCDNENDLSKLCFESIKTYDADSGSPLPKYSCIRARIVIDEHRQKCRTPQDCGAHLYCLRPYLTNETKLIEIQRRKNSKNVLFVGHPGEVLQDIEISEFTQLSYILPIWIPNRILKLCNFILMFSGALATLNLIPCFYFDGHYIANVLVHLCVPRSIEIVLRNTRFEFTKLFVASFITTLGSCILVGYSALIFILLYLR